METRLASVADAPSLAALHAASFGAAQWSVGQIADSLALKTTQAWIVSDNHEPLGFMLSQWVGLEAEILTFCVTPSAQGRGLGRHLLISALAAVKERGAQRVFLEVAVDNHVACSLYQKYGFRRIGTRVNYYQRGDEKIDAILFALELETAFGAIP